MFKIILLAIFLQCVSSLEPTETCLAKSKLELCYKFFQPEEREECFNAIHPFYQKGTLNMCVTNRQIEHRCVELRFLCDEYIFVAIYAPHWPKNKEYEIVCTETYSLGIPLALMSLVVVIGLYMMCCRKRQQGPTSPIFIGESIPLNTSSPQYGSLNSVRLELHSLGESEEIELDPLMDQQQLIEVEFAEEVHEF